MRAYLSRCPLQMIAAGYLVTAAVLGLAVLQAAHGQWQCLFLFAGTAAAFLAGFRLGLTTPEAPEEYAETEPSWNARPVEQSARSISWGGGSSSAWLFDFKARSFAPQPEAIDPDDRIVEPGIEMHRVTVRTSSPAGSYCAPRAFTAATAVDQRSWRSSETQRWSM